MAGNMMNKMLRNRTWAAWHMHIRHSDLCQSCRCMVRWKTWKRRLVAAHPQSRHLHRKANIYNAKSAIKV